MTQLQYSQNNLVVSDRIKTLFNTLSIRKDELVIDIGAGSGNITELILGKTTRIKVYEMDQRLIQKLHERFGNRIEIIEGDFLLSPLPEERYKVVSNIPFSSTSDILKRIFSHKLFDGGYIIIQKEAAWKYCGEQLEKLNTLMSVTLGIEYSFKNIYSFSQIDFTPSPSVDIIFLEILRRKETIVKDVGIFRDFVAYVFNKSIPNISSLSDIISDMQFKKFKEINGIERDSKPSELSISQYIAMFNILKLDMKKLSKISGRYSRIEASQKDIEKYHRTRLDRNWKRK